MADIRGTMNLGGGKIAQKMRLVSDLTEQYRQLNLVLGQTETMSRNIADNLTRAKAAGSGIAGGRSSSTLPGAAVPPPPGAGAGGFIGANGPIGPGGFMDQPQPGMLRQFGGNLLRGLPGLAGSAGLALTQAIDAGQYIENQIARTRFGFMGGGGAPGAAFQRMMNRGTAIDPMDAARAAMAGMSNGMMPGLANYSSIANSAAMFSNLVPGAGLAGGMGAVTALNQAGNANRLRMLGINVRDPGTGLMRSFEDIANDLWSHLNRQKTGGRAISKQDIAMSLQPGNALDSILNQYFGNDPVLRQGVVSALMQKATGSGMSRQELIETGALPDVAASFGGRNAASYNAINAFTGAGVSGVMEANQLLADASNKFASSVDLFDGAVKQLVKFETLAGGGNGAGGTMMGGVAAFLGGALGPLFGRILSLVKGAGAAGAAGAARGAASGALAVLGKIAGGGLGAALSGMFGFKDARQSKSFSGGTFLLNSLIGAGTGFMVGGVPGAIVGGLAGGGGYLGGYLLGSAGGEGGGEDTSMPLSGSPRITSPFGKIRHLTNNGKQSPTYGRPHGGTDFGVPVGTPVHAAKDGTVIGTNTDPDGLGVYVKIRHDDGFESLYGHLSQKIAPAGTRVEAGDLIGLSGNTGFSTGPHLHFQVQKNGEKYDPLAYIQGAVTPGPISASSVSAAATSSSGWWPGSLGTLTGTSPADTMSGGVGGEAYASNGGTVINYGGVNVTVSVPGGTQLNEEKLAREIKRVLEDQEQFNRAVHR